MNRLVIQYPQHMYPFLYRIFPVCIVLVILEYKNDMEDLEYLQTYCFKFAGRVRDQEQFIGKFLHQCSLRWMDPRKVFHLVKMYRLLYRSIKKLCDCDRDTILSSIFKHEDSWTDFLSSAKITSGIYDKMDAFSFTPYANAIQPYRYKLLRPRGKRGKKKSKQRKSL